jgi:pimeloyl-ACP methyl ester carboxylesterase
VDRLAILNAAHPRRLQQGLRNPNQLRRLAGTTTRRSVRSPPACAGGGHRAGSAGRIARAAIINYYRAAVRQSKQAQAQLRPIAAPTLVIWGQRDRYLGSKPAEPDRDDVPNLERVERLPDASHSVHHDEAERVTQLLTDFFAPARLTQHR